MKRIVAFVCGSRGLPRLGIMTSTTFPTILFTLACFSTSAAFAGSGSKTAQQKDISLTLSVASCKELPERTLHQAEAETARIFRQIGITMQWRDSESESERARRSDRFAGLELRIVNQVGSIPLSKGGLALAHWAEGSPATAVVMLPRAIRLGGERQVPPEVVLGCLIAHELGHVLLRSPRHSPFGIMRNPWNPDDLHKARAGHLGFTDDQARPIRDAARLLMRRSQGEQDEDSDGGVVLTSLGPMAGAAVPHPDVGQKGPLCRGRDGSF